MTERDFGPPWGVACPNFLQNIKIQTKHWFSYVFIYLPQKHHFINLQTWVTKARWISINQTTIHRDVYLRLSPCHSEETMSHVRQHLVTIDSFHTQLYGVYFTAIVQAKLSADFKALAHISTHQKWYSLDMDRKYFDKLGTTVSNFLHIKSKIWNSESVWRFDNQYKCVMY